MQEQQTAVPVVLPPMGAFTPEQNAQKSLTHWVWTPYKDISNMMPWGIKSQIGYREQRWTEFKRCVPYPLGNITERTVDIESAATAHASMQNVSGDTIERKSSTKYAQEQAAELGQSYSEVGFRVLLPLLGMDDRERVTQIVQTVQPFEYEIHEMEYEFSKGAEKRINESNLPEDDKAKAREVARIMLAGACGKTYKDGVLMDSARDAQSNAMAKALSEYEALISSMSDKMAGQPGISNPNPFHHWICRQLGKPVPERIDRTGSQNNQNAAIDILAKRALREETAAESMSAELQAERDARKALEERLAKLEKTKAA